jgi:hypothetical protein
MGHAALKSPSQKCLIIIIKTAAQPFGFQLSPLMMKVILLLGVVFVDARLHSGNYTGNCW